MSQSDIFLLALIIYLIGFVIIPLLYRYEVMRYYHEDELLFSIVLWPAWLVVFILFYCVYYFKTAFISFWLWMANKHE